MVTLPVFFLCASAGVPLPKSTGQETGRSGSGVRPAAYGPYLPESNPSVGRLPGPRAPVKPWIVQAALSLVPSLRPAERLQFLSGLEDVEVGHAGGPSRPLSSFPGLLPGSGVQQAYSPDVPGTVSQ